MINNRKENEQAKVCDPGPRGRQILVIRPGAFVRGYFWSNISIYCNFIFVHLHFLKKIFDNLHSNIRFSNIFICLKSSSISMDLLQLFYFDYVLIDFYCISTDFYLMFMFSVNFSINLTVFPKFQMVYFLSFRMSRDQARRSLKWETSENENENRPPASTASKNNWTVRNDEVII